jgi:hypothetical protein
MVYTKYKIQINGSVYLTTGKMADTLIHVAKEKYEKEGKNAIVAIRKGQVQEMLREVYGDSESLDCAIMEYNRKGFLVYFNKAKEAK